MKKHGWFLIVFFTLWASFAYGQQETKAYASQSLSPLSPSDYQTMAGWTLPSGWEKYGAQELLRLSMETKSAQNKLFIRRILMDRFPSTPEGRTAQAAIADSNKAGDAKPILEEVVKLPNAPVLSVNNLLVHYKFKDQPEKSLELIERGIALDPEFSSYLFFWYKTSWINVNKGREDAKAYIKSLEARFGTGHWLLDYLQARLDEDTYKENALQSYAKSVSRKGAGYEAWNRYISLLWKVGSEKDRYSWGKYPDAGQEDVFRFVFTAASSFPSAYERAAVFEAGARLFASVSPDDASMLYYDALREEASPERATGLFDVLITQNKYDEALSIAESARKTLPMHWETSYLMARASEEIKGNLPEAFSYYVQSVKEAPNDYLKVRKARELHRFIHRVTGDPERALHVVRGLASYTAHPQERAQQEFEIYRSAGRNDDALKSLDAVQRSSSPYTNDVRDFYLSVLTRLAKPYTVPAVNNATLPAGLEGFLPLPDGSIILGSKPALVWNKNLKTARVNLGNLGILKALSPDGRSLAFLTAFTEAGNYRSDEVNVADPVTGERSFRFLFSEAKLTSLAWSPDGSFLAVGTEKGEILIFDPRKAGLAGRIHMPGTKKVENLLWLKSGVLLFMLDYATWFYDPVKRRAVKLVQGWYTAMADNFDGSSLLLMANASYTLLNTVTWKEKTGKVVVPEIPSFNPSKAAPHPLRNVFVLSPGLVLFDADTEKATVINRDTNIDHAEFRKMANGQVQLFYTSSKNSSYGILEDRTWKKVEIQ